MFVMHPDDADRRKRRHSQDPIDAISVVQHWRTWAFLIGTQHSVNTRTLPVGEEGLYFTKISQAYISPKTYITYREVHGHNAMLDIYLP